MSTDTVTTPRRGGGFTVVFAGVVTVIALAAAAAGATGLVTGPGHGSVVQGPDGNWWQFYTIVLANPPGGRRIGMEAA